MWYDILVNRFEWFLLVYVSAIVVAATVAFFCFRYFHFTESSKTIIKYFVPCMLSTVSIFMVFLKVNEGMLNLS